MKNKTKKLVKRGLKAAGIVLAAILLLTGLTYVPLALPELENPAEDRFVGFHVVPGNRSTDRNSAYWSDYGSETFDTGKYGLLDLPRRVLFGVLDESGHRMIFPGLEGYNCFITYPAEGGQDYTGSYMELSDSALSIGGEEDSISGTLYCGAQSRMFTFYRVFETPDGQFYLDGSGNSYSGEGGFTGSERHKNTITMDGETTTAALSVSVKVELIEPLTQVTAHQYDGENRILKSGAWDGSEDAVSLTLQPDAQWVLVEEEYAADAVKRTAYDCTGEEFSHTAWFLDENQIGRGVLITFQP